MKIQLREMTPYGNYFEEGKEAMDYKCTGIERRADGFVGITLKKGRAKERLALLIPAGSIAFIDVYDTKVEDPMPGDTLFDQMRIALGG